MKRSVVVGCGSYLPENIVTNYDLAKQVNTSHEWIVERTGVHSRRFASEGELTSDLASKAGKEALKLADLKPGDIDLVIVGTVTSDDTFPSTATRVQAKLGIKECLAFDVAAACSGFLLALSTADNYLRLGQATTALVIGAETFSRIIDMKDRQTCVLFGDGAGALILRAEDGPHNCESRGILGTYLHSDGQYRDLLHTNGGPSSTSTSGYICMEGREVFRHAVEKLTHSAKNTLKAHSLNVSDINWFVPHQANIRIIDAVAKKLSVPSEKVISTVRHHANTSAASIPLALCEAVSDGRIKSGDLILHEAIGGGFVWGSSLVRW
jgi:3-oxoacyl-[acyl-carrier-protein] synthase-3